MTYSINLILLPQTRNVTHLHKHPFQVGNYNSCQDWLPRETGKAVLFRGMVFDGMLQNPPVISLVAEQWREIMQSMCQGAGYTFCKGSSSFPRATMATITIPAEIMPATWKTCTSYEQGPPCSLGSPGSLGVHRSLPACGCPWCFSTPRSAQDY